MHGYFLEITKLNLTKTPKHFKLLKDLKKSKFFTTDELNAIEEKIENAEANISSLEKKLFDEITKKLLTVVQFLYKIADEVAELDEIQSFAQVAVMNFWVKPKITENGLLKILDGRHPVVEYHLPHGEFIPNDLTLCAQNPSLEKNTKNEHKTFALITGPNMAGKSTFLRQNALIVLLAQMGSFVPASSATIGICDKIFCRVGASDNLARGESTFLVEMSETAFILQNATEKSLVIMDEVGRGTSTEDGLAIAQAVSEYLLNTIKAKTIFATHYHELATLEHPALLHLKLEVANEADKIIFLKKVSEGVSENSYGIHVAKIAGIPQSAIDRAEKLLAIIAKERRDIDTSLLQMPTESSETETKAPKLFSTDELILNEIASLDINNLRPIDALQLLEMWKRELESK